ncbi:MAG: hypothetical protein PUP92_31585 [Rhizonema sp. PD38]|nr:hypothetical protein [Rhizonema sp. PD38]
MSSHPSSSTKMEKRRKARRIEYSIRQTLRKRDPNAHTVKQNHAEALELELLAQEAYERSDYIHMAYSSY